MSGKIVDNIATKRSDQVKIMDPQAVVPRLVRGIQEVALKVKITTVFSLKDRNHEIFPDTTARRRG